MINKVDCIVNLHGGGTHTVNDFIYVPRYSGKVGDETIELARAFGQRVLYLGPAVAGCATTYAAEERRIPGIVSELGCDLMWPSAVRSFVEKGIRGVKNVLIHLGMLQGKMTRPEDGQLFVNDRTCIKSKQGGLFLPEYGLEGLGKKVAKASLLGRIIDPQTFEEVERLTTPYDEGLLFLLRGYSRVHPGDYMFHVGDMATVERVD